MVSNLETIVIAVVAATGVAGYIKYTLGLVERKIQKAAETETKEVKSAVEKLVGGVEKAILESKVVVAERQPQKPKAPVLITEAAPPQIKRKKFLTLEERREVIRERGKSPEVLARLSEINRQRIANCPLIAPDPKAQTDHANWRKDRIKRS